MVKVTNNTRETVNFVTKGNPKNGVPPTDHVEPGQTKAIDVDPESRELKAAVFAGRVSIEKGGAKVDSK
jgi:hypothetical protein